MDLQQTVDDEIDLLALLPTLRRRWLTILVVTMVIMLATTGVTMLVLPPQYESRAQILLSENSAPAFATAEAAARYLTGRSFLEPIARAYGIRVTTRLVLATPVRDARIVELRIRYTDREKLHAFTDALIREFLKRSSERINARRQSAGRLLAGVDAQLREIELTIQLTRQTLQRIAAGPPGDAASWLGRSVVLNSVGTSEALYSGLLNAQRDLRNEILALEGPTLIQEPYIPPEPVSPRLIYNMGIAVVLGVLAGIIVAFALEASQTRSGVAVPAQSAPVSSPSAR
jgi:uncharacterized protein involved in exopolysaccharide biosynthesis